MERKRDVEREGQENGEKKRCREEGVLERERERDGKRERQENG